MNHLIGILILLVCMMLGLLVGVIRRLIKAEKDLVRLKEKSDEFEQSTSQVNQLAGQVYDLDAALRFWQLGKVHQEDVTAIANKWKMQHNAQQREQIFWQFVKQNVADSEEELRQIRTILHHAKPQTSEDHALIKRLERSRQQIEETLPSLRAGLSTQAFNAAVGPGVMTDDQLADQTDYLDEDQ